jgi:hypothetical protein
MAINQTRLYTHTHTKKIVYTQRCNETIKIHLLENPLPTNKKNSGLKEDVEKILSQTNLVIKRENQEDLVIGASTVHSKIVKAV